MMHRSIAWFGRLPSTYFVLLVGFLASGIAYWGTAWFVERDAEQRLEGQAHETAVSLQARISAYADLLHSIKAAYRTTDYLSWKEFHALYEGLAPAQRYPGFQQLDFTLYTLEHRRGRLEQTLQNEDYWRSPGRDFFQVYPAGEREDYFVAYYAEPLERYRSRIGFDRGSVAGDRVVLQRARQSGRVEALYQPGQNDLELLLAIYRPDQPVDTPSQRAGSVLGIASVRFSLPALMQTLIAENTQQRYRFALYPQQQARPLWGQISHGLTAEEEITVGHERWVLSVAPLQGQLLGWTSPAALSALAGGSALTLLLALNVMLARRVTRMSAERKFRVVFESARDPHLLLTPEGVIIEANPATPRLLGVAADEPLAGRPVDDFVLPVHSLFQPSAAEQRAKALAEGELNFERWQRTAHGELLLVEVALSRLLLDGQVRLLETWRDLTQQRHAAARIRYLAMHDELTSLPNRNHFHQLLARAVEDAVQREAPLSLFFIDLDRFKHINDSLGHRIGDEALAEFAERLRLAMHPGEVAARLGGDEFAVLVTESVEGYSTTRRAEELLMLADEPVLLAGQEFYLSVSMGIAIFPDDGLTADELLQRADVAMHRAKSLGRHNYQYYAAAPNDGSFLSLEASLRRALDRRELFLVYQPRVELQDGRVSGMEALIRWQHPEYGLVMPMRFIPVAEETGLITDIGRFVLDEACRQNKAFQQAGLPPVRVSVNLSARQFMQPELVHHVREALAKSGLAAEWLELEITEGMVMHNPARAIAMLHDLKRLGVSLSIDDFGTGYSSLAYLKRFPIDCIKIDRSFVRDLPHDADDVAIADAIMALGRALSLKVVAEGAETREQVEFLQRHGCNECQGYFYSQPLAVADFQTFLARNHE